MPQEGLAMHDKDFKAIPRNLGLPVGCLRIAPGLRFRTIRPTPRRALAVNAAALSAGFWGPRWPLGTDDFHSPRHQCTQRLSGKTHICPQRRGEGQGKTEFSQGEHA